MATKTAKLVVPATATLLLFLSFSLTATAVVPVDTDGNFINEHSEYYIVSAGTFESGNLLGRAPSPFSEDGCPLYVSVSYFVDNPLEAVKLVKAQNQTMSSRFSAEESVYYNINSGITNTTKCRSHGYWYGGRDEWSGLPVVFGNGDIDQLDSSSTKFTMEKVPSPFGPSSAYNIYKMYTCVSKGQRLCGYLGPFYSPRLGLKVLTFTNYTTSYFHEPLEVVFIKKKDGQKTPYAAAT